MDFRYPSVIRKCVLASACALLSRPVLAQTSPQSVEPPSVLEQTPAVYPPAELTKRRQVIVVLLVTVGRDGTVTHVELAESGGEAFDAEAILAVTRWRFAPATRAGEAVPSRIRIPFRFDPPARVSEQAEPPRAVETAPGRPAEVVVLGERELRSEQRSSGDFRVRRDVLSAAPRREGAEALRTVPGLTLGRGEGSAVAHAYMLRGFDAEHGQDIEFRVGGLPINQPSHLHGQGYADLGFLIGETVREVRVSEGVYDPRQGDFAVAGSIDIGLGVNEDERGLVVRSGYGSFGTFRELVLWAPREEAPETFGAVE
jgi:iron complex outermembrane recepter protein